MILSAHDHGFLCCWLQVTGQGLDLIRLFYNLLPQRHNWCAHP